SSGTTASFENYNFADVTARYVMITVNGNTGNNWASISEINIKTFGTSTIPPTDTTPPITTIVKVTDGNNNVVSTGGTTNSNSISITFTVDGTGSSVVGSTCQLDSKPAAACTSPVSYTGLSSVTHTVGIGSTDLAGNVEHTAEFTWAVNPPLVVDTTPPVITLVGSNPVTVQFGSTYTDAGATATDNIDGNITPSIVTVNPVNTGVAGTYFVTYNVKDAAGNAATQVARMVIVSDPPTPTGFTLRLDSFGVQDFYAQDPRMQSYVLTGNPNSQPGSRLDGGGSATAGVDGALNYWTFPGRVGGLASGGTETTARINLNPQLSTG